MQVFLLFFCKNMIMRVTCYLMSRKINGYWNEKRSGNHYRSAMICFPMKLIQLQALLDSLDLIHCSSCAAVVAASALE